eukprot:4670193-Pyramimonas_sp.AAC.1
MHPAGILSFVFLLLLASRARLSSKVGVRGHIRLLQGVIGGCWHCTQQAGLLHPRRPCKKQCYVIAGRPRMIKGSLEGA